MGEATWLLQGHFDESGGFTSSMADWAHLAEQLTELWFGPQATSPVKGPKVVPDFHHPGVQHVVTPPSEEDIKEWKAAAKKGDSTSSEPPVRISPVMTPDAREYVEIENTPPKVPNPMRKTMLIAEKKLQRSMKKTANNKESKETKPMGEEPDAKEQKAKGKKPRAETKTKSDGKSDKKKKDKNRKRRPNNGPLKVAMDLFIKGGKEKGWTHAK